MIDLTFSRHPPSLNHLFANATKGRRITKEYAAWRKEAGWELKLQKQKPIVGPVTLSFVFGEGGADLGNSGEKAITDLLVEHGLIEGDTRKTVKAIHLGLLDSVEGVKVKVLPFV